MTTLPLQASDRFDRYAAAVNALRHHFPNIHALLNPGTRLEDLEGWQALVQRHDAFQAQGRPIVVATLYGPTGAGKSTLFRLLTGIDVPAGDVVRPMSYACVVAVPEDIDQPERLAPIFPGFTLEALTDPQQLRKPDPRKERLFHVNYPPSDHAALPLILADVPDFDSVARDNWAKAEYMLRRAQFVLFLVYGEAYATDVAVRELARSCQIAARLAYVFTKTPDPEHARPKWEHLLDTLRKKLTPHADKFHEKRADGRSLLDFLADCPVYYSPRRDAPAQPTLAEVQPVQPNTPGLTSLLRGLDAENVLLEGLLEPTGRVVQHCLNELAAVQVRIDQQATRLMEAEKPLAEVANKIAASEFPISRMLEVVLSTAGQHQGWFIKGVLKPFRWLRGLAGGLVHATKGLFNMFRNAGGEQEHLRPQHEVEMRKLGEGTEHLILAWRAAFRHLDAETLGQQRARQVADEFKMVGVPTPANTWEHHLQQSVAVWAKKNPWLCDLLPSVGELMTVLGGGVLVLDLFIGGGLFTAHVGPLGIAGVAGAGGAAAGAFLKWINKWQLEDVLKEANQQWTLQRSTELADHLRTHFYLPMFHPWREQLERLQTAPVTECREACRTLEEMMQSLRKGASPMGNG